MVVGFYIGHLVVNGDGNVLPRHVSWPVQGEQ